MMKRNNDSRPSFRKPPPKGVVEIVGELGRGWSLVELKNGALFAAGGSHFKTSDDGGLTWSEAKPFPEGIMGNGLLRLQSGAVALTIGDASSRLVNNGVWLSHDEAGTWQSKGPANLLGNPYSDVMIQLQTGRLLFPSRIGFQNANHPELLRDDVVTIGMWKGLPRLIAGHYHNPEIDIAAVSRSDDEGTTWELGDDCLMGWFDADGVPNGQGGVTACDEPSIAETNDGRVLFFARSTVGRIVSSSSSDSGETWSAVRPTDLPASYSPPYLTRIPSTGDLLCVWNQVSREEIRKGYRRNRLSAAISKDCGFSWQNFKTIEVSSGIEDMDRLSPEQPITPVVGMRNVGAIPDDFAIFRYQNVCFVREKVYLLYVREWFELEEQSDVRFEDAEPHKVVQGREQVMRIYPLEYFYS